MGAICISQWKCAGGEGNITRDRNFNSDDRASHGHNPAGHAKHASPTRRATHASSIEPCRLASAKSSSSPPQHHHHAHKRLGTLVLGKFGPGPIGTRSGPDQTPQSWSRSGIFPKKPDRSVSSLGIPILPETVQTRSGPGLHNCYLHK